MPDGFPLPRPALPHQTTPRLRLAPRLEESEYHRDVFGILIAHGWAIKRKAKNLRAKDGEPILTGHANQLRGVHRITEPTPHQTTSRLRLASQLAGKETGSDDLNSYFGIEIVTSTSEAMCSFSFRVGKLSALIFWKLSRPKVCFSPRLMR